MQPFNQINRPMKSTLIALLFVTLICYQCNSTKPGPRLLPDSSGRINTLTVVMPKKDWSGPLGERVREELQKEYEGLPLVEPQFSVTYLPPPLFDGFAKHSRNIILFTKDSISAFNIYQDRYAAPQVVSSIKGEDASVQAFYFEENKDLIKRTIIANERKEKRRRMRKSPAKTKSIEKRFGISMLYPTAYKEFKVDTNFVWIQKEIPKGHLNLIVYALDRKAYASKISSKVLKIRDSIGKIHIPGRLEDTHMSNDNSYRPYYYKMELKGRETYLTKGMWSVSDDYMAGPFVHYMIADIPRERWLVIEGFAFAPSANKREYMFELETIARSVQFNKK